MGFHVTLREDDRHLLDVIRLNPAEVFGRPYAGYLLFLVGGADVGALEWLRTHLVPLDSLTGEHVAFAVFAEKIPVQLDVPYNPHSERPSRFLGEVPLTDVRRIDSYIKSGKVGLVADGDHLNAMTYATDRVARAFGVLQRLPCLLVLDAFVTDRVDVVEMGDAQLGQLLSVLRSATHRLIQDPRFTAFNEALEVLGSVQRRHDDLSAHVGKQKRLLSHIPVSQDVDASIRQVYEAILDSLRRGSHREFRRQLAELRNYAEDRIQIDLDENTRRRVVGYGKPLAAINDIEQREWPLTGPDDVHCRELLSHHVARLLSDFPVPSTVADKHDLQVLKRLLTDRQSILVGEIIASLPDETSITNAAHREYDQRRVDAERKLETLGTELEALRERANLALQVCLSEEAPSFTKIVKKIAQERKLKLVASSVGDKAVAYAGKVLDPKNIIRIIGALGGAS